MSARIPTAGLGLAVLLGLLPGGPTARAKPPDLPANQEVLCAPEAAPLAGTAVEHVVAPADVDVRVAAAWCKALRTAQRCLLCGAHPLLALLPDSCLLAEDYEEAAAALLAGQAADSGEENAEPRDAVLPAGTPVSPPQGLAPGVVPPVPPRMAPPVGPPANDFVCPYLREEDARQNRTQACPLATPSDVVGNLHKLEEAQKLVEHGDFYRDTGRPGPASFYYEKAQRLCPGSRCAQTAGEHLRLLTARPRMVSAAYNVGDLLDGSSADDLVRCITTIIHPQSWDGMGGPGIIRHDVRGHTLVVYQTPDVQELVADFLAERRRQMAERKTATPAEEESGPPPAADPSGEEEQSVAPVSEQRVGPLLEACQRAVHGGRYARAEELARRALALDADAVVEHPLVYKEHLLTELAAKVGHPVVVCPGSAESPSPSLGLPCSAELLQRFGVLYQEGLYAEAEQCALQGLALDPQNPALAAAAQLAAAHWRMKASPDETSSCPSAAPPCTMRRPDLPPVSAGIPAALDNVLTTAGEPTEEGLQITVDETSGSAEESEAAGEPGKVTPSSDWWRDLVDVIRSSACAEVEGTPLASRGCCRVPLGCVTGELSWDNRGDHGSIMLKLQAFDAPERSAGQRQEARPKDAPRQP